MKRGRRRVPRWLAFVVGCASALFCILNWFWFWGDFIMGWPDRTENTATLTEWIGTFLVVFGAPSLVLLIVVLIGVDQIHQQHCSDSEAPTGDKENESN